MTKNEEKVLPVSFKVRDPKSTAHLKMLDVIRWKEEETGKEWKKATVFNWLLNRCHEEEVPEKYKINFTRE